jgi:effector-binding domain-containing protein
LLKKMSFALLFLLTAFVLGGFFLPHQFHVERSVSVDRPASVVFALLNSYQTFNEWSPWAARDPDASYALSGPESGAGARLSWKGDPRTVGEGWQEITVGDPSRRIDIQMDFGEQGRAQSYFDLTEQPGNTFITWGFDTDISEGNGVLGTLVGKYFGLFLDKWVGADYEQGLQSFKQFAESLPPADFGGSVIDVVDAVPVDILYVSGDSSQESTDVATALANAYREISVFMTEQGIEIVGQPMAITRGWDENGYQFDAAIPVNQLPEETSGNVHAGQSPSGPAVRYTHVGPYDDMLSAYAELASYMAANGLSEGPMSWEHYISDPGSTPAEEIITHIYFLIQQ